MLCLKKRRTYSFTQGVNLPRRSKKDNSRYEVSLDMAVTTLPRKNRSREERPSRMVLTVTEDTPADMLAGSMELLVHLPRDHHPQTQRVTVQRSTPMMDLLVQIATGQKLSASNYTLQAIGERGLLLPHQPNTPIGALDALQVKLLPKQGTFVPRKTKQANQPFETTFRLQVHLPRNQLYVSRVSPKMNLGEILDEVCREKNLDRNKYELRHPANVEEVLDPTLSLQDYHLQEVTLYARQSRPLGSALSSQDIMALQRQEERRRQQARQGVFGFVFKKSKEGSLSTDSLGGRSASPARSDETGRSASPVQPPARPQRKRRPAPKPPVQVPVNEENADDPGKDKVVISHSRNSSDSSGYHESSVLSDNPESANRLPETLPRRGRAQDGPRKLAQTSQSSKSLGNLATVSGTLGHGISSTSLSSAGLRKKRAAPPPPSSRPLSSALSTQALERIVDSEESLTSDIEPSKPPSDIGVPSKASSDLGVGTKTSRSVGSAKDVQSNVRGYEIGSSRVEESRGRSVVEDTGGVETGRPRRVGEPVPLPKPRKVSASNSSTTPKVPKRRLAPLSAPRRSLGSQSDHVENENASSTGELRDRRTSEEAGDAKGSNNDERIHDDAFSESSACEANPSVDSDDGVVTPRVDDVTEIGGKETDAFVGETDLRDTNDNAKEPESVETEVKSERTLNETHIETVTDKPKLEENLVSTKVSVGVKTSTKKSKALCAVISTVPKCDHLDVLTEGKILPTRFERQDDKETAKKGNLNDKNDPSDHDQDAQEKLEADEEIAEETARSTKRGKIFRSKSKANDFETNSLERQKRHLTSHAEDITFALNFNLSTYANHVEDNCSAGLDDGMLRHGLMGISDTEAVLSETDILLQKVSDTLSSSLPSNVSPDVEETADPKSNSALPKPSSPARPRVSRDSREDTSNVTLSSQQDTSDYVSAVDEDLSLTDWEYQLPAPPSAFRDSNTPVYDHCASTAYHSVDVRKLRSETDVPTDGSTARSKGRSRPDASLRKEMINELEDKLDHGTLVQKEVPRRLVEKIAPADNTLANFKITTYAKQKSLNIFEESDQVDRSGSADERFMSSFPTLTRGKGNEKRLEEELECRRPEPKTNEQVVERWKLEDEKKGSKTGSEKVERVNVSLKKSTSISGLKTAQPRSNEKFSQWRENILKRQEEPTKEKQLQSLQVLKSILPQLKSAQPAEESVPKEQTGAVLIETPRAEATPIERSIEVRPVEANRIESHSRKPESKADQTKRYTYSGPPAISLGSWSERPSVNVQIKTDTDYKLSGSKMTNGRTIVSINSTVDEEPTKKFVSHGTSAVFKKPALNHVTIVDTRPTEKPVVTGVELKRKDNTDARSVDYRDSFNLETRKNFLEKSEGRNDDSGIDTRPINFKELTGVGLKKVDRLIGPAEASDESGKDESSVDTRPVNFKELTKAFGQEVCLRTKPKRLNPNRRSDISGMQPESIEVFTKQQNGYASVERVQSEVRPKRFTSVVGINTPSVTQNGHYAPRNNLNVAKSNGPMPVVKGFKIQAGTTNVKIGGTQNGVDACRNVPQPPKPPTMPVITGVTLKSTRPRTMPVQIDPRDMLLESIRSFGGRGKLKSATERC